MRFHEIIQEAKEAANFNVDGVIDALISEMRQRELTNPEDWVDLYNDDKPQEPLADEDRPWRTASFKVWLGEHILSVFHSLHTDEPIRAWRAIVANSGWTPENSGQHIGRHWTYTKDKAIPYEAGQDSGTLFVIEAMIPPSSVDWEEMVLHHLTRDAEEDEVTIHDGAPVQIVNIQSEPYGTGEDHDEPTVAGRHIHVADPRFGNSQTFVDVGMGTYRLHSDPNLVAAMRTQWPDHPALAEFDREVAEAQRAAKRSDAAKKAAAAQAARA